MPKGKKTIPKLTKKQKGFCDDYLETGNGTQSVLKNYNTDDYHTAWWIASDNLKLPKIWAYLDDKGDDAGSRIEQIAKDTENDVNVRLRADMYIYDHSNWKATIKLETKEDDTQFDKKLELWVFSPIQLEEKRRKLLEQ